MGKSKTRRGKPNIPSECRGKNSKLLDIKKDTKASLPIKSLNPDAEIENRWYLDDVEVRKDGCGDEVGALVE